MTRYKPFERQKEKNTAPLIWAAGLALFAIALFVALLVIEQHIVVTEHGLWFDFSGGAPEQAVKPDFVQVPEIVMENPGTGKPGGNTTYDPKSFPTDAIYAMELPLDASAEQLAHYPVNTVILPVRDGSGVIGYASSVEAAARHATEQTVALKEVIEQYHQAGYQVFARISVYADDAFVADNPASALKSISADAWSDNAGNRWANPYSSVFFDYFEELLTEYASFAFDGYLFENMTFPYAGKLSDCYYVDDNLAERQAQVAKTAELVLKALRGRKVWYMLDVPTVTSAAANEVTGVDIAVLDQAGFGIAPMLTVSSSGNLAYQLSEARQCVVVDYGKVLASLARLPSPSLAFLPLVEVAGSIQDAMLEGVTGAMAAVAEASPKSYALSLGAGEYAPVMLPSAPQGDVTTGAEPENP